MPIFKKYLVVLKYVVLISIFIKIYNLFNGDIYIMLLFFVFSSLLMANDYVRNNKLQININNKYYTSLILTILGTAVLGYFIGGVGASVYLFFPLVELMKQKGLKLRVLFSLHLILFLIIISKQEGSKNLDDILNLGINLLNYFAVVCISYSYIIVKREKEEVNKLNEKLNNTNIKLQQYILEVEELTASKERTMMAQELHDSVGHSLMALVMHLEFAKKVSDVKQDKLKEVLIKCEEIAKASISSLRDVVNLLKEEREIENLNSSIDEIIDNFRMLNHLKINFNSVENLNDLSSTIKNYLHKTIKEAITNSIKHGKATEINITIVRFENCIRLILIDNGVGCSEIIKSNGLSGIENRITSLSGSVKYFNNDNSGFGIEINIPIIMEEI